MLQRSARYILIIVTPAFVRSANLPYNPARILYSEHLTAQYAYLLQPATDSLEATEFSSIDLSKSQDGSDLALNSLSTDLPFISTASTAYTAILGSSGNITVLAGDCTAGGQGAGVWRFQLDADAQNGNGTWAKDIVDPQPSADSTAMTGSNFLSAGVAFSTNPDATDLDADLFYFGGMCPKADTDPSAWVTSAQYSNLMLTMSPQASIVDDLDYQLKLVSDNGPPVAEAGFTITPLAPTYANASDGSQTQQQDFVLLGGHTQNAFINMSQIALFSLPQAVWSFIPVDQPIDSSATKRSVQTNVVTPRSGHTAVVASDGKSIIVYGGWVGNVTSPAAPQLAIIELGVGFGGSGDWHWTVPPQTGTSASSIAGLYGHGAVMLPGNVMMIVGGYPISNSAGLKRRDGTKNQAQFYNITSNSWLTSYSTSAATTSAAATTTHTSSSSKVGIAIGVVAGLLAAGVLVAVAFWFKRRAQRKRDARDSLSRTLVDEKEQARLANIAPIEPQVYSPENPYAKDDLILSTFPWLPEVPLKGDHHAENADCTGVYRNIPSPTRGLRKTSGTRSHAYQAAHVPEERRGIHMIEERDEEGSIRSRPYAMTGQYQQTENRHAQTPDVSRPATSTTDPFKDPNPSPLRSNPVSPEISQHGNTNMSPSMFGHKSVSIHKEQIANWVTQWSAPHEMHSGSGRISPSKHSERTRSDLSDRSHYSSYTSRSLARTTSTRSNVMGLGLPGHHSDLPTPYTDHTFSFNQDKRPSFEDLKRKRSLPGSMRTAARQLSPKRSFARLRSEGAALLGGTQESRRPPSSNYSDDKEHVTHQQCQSSTSSNLPRKAGWMGSIKRVFGTVSDRSVSANEVGRAFGADRSLTTSPSKSLTAPTRRPPHRRTASESSAFLRLKQGKQDWSTSGKETAWNPFDDGLDTGDWGDPGPPSPPPPVPSHKLIVGNGQKRKPVPGPKVTPSNKGKENNEDDDWDVEQAAAGRDFQVMFTMPKARLRVVNADLDRQSMRSVSDERRSIKSTENVASHVVA